MSFLRRLARLVTGEARSAFERLDDPSASVAEAYRTQLELVDEVRRRMAEVLTAQKRLEMRASAAARERDALRTTAAAALEGGDEQRARALVMRANARDAEIGILGGEIRELHDRVATLQANAEQLSAQADRLRVERDLMSARVSAAKAGIAANASLAGLTPEYAEIRALLDEARTRCTALEARAAELAEMVERGSYDEAGDRVREATSDEAVAHGLRALTSSSSGGGGS